MPSLYAFLAECERMPTIPVCAICGKEIQEGEKNCKKCNYLKTVSQANLELILIITNRLLNEDKNKKIKQKLLRGDFK